MGLGRLQSLCRIFIGKQAMNRSEVTEKVKLLMAEKGYFGDEPTEETTLDDLGWDSLDYAEIQMNIEKEFFISPKDAEWEHARNVGQWIDVVMKHIKVD